VSAEALLAYSADRLLDGTGAAPRPEVAVLVRDERIEALVPIAQLPADAQHTHFPGATLLSGLIDCHVHLGWDGSADPKVSALADGEHLGAIKAAVRAAQSLAAGVTTLRDLGGMLGTILAARAAVDDGTLVGSRLLVAGPALAVTGGSGLTTGVEVDGADGVRARTRALIKAGVDVLKIMVTGGVYSRGPGPGALQMTADEVAAAVETAHHAGLRVAAHAEGLEGIELCVKLGVDTIEHGNFLSEDLARCMAEAGTNLVPTLEVFRRIAEGRLGVPAEAARRARDVLEASYRALELVERFGVPLAAGTDAGSINMPHSPLVDELEAYVAAGLSPARALEAATRAAAVALGRSADLGTLEPGKLADFVIVDGDPLEQIAALRSVRGVVKSGRLVVDDGQRAVLPLNATRGEQP
jgi:imidazolonepropionase-like amidohydrolase